MLRSTKQATRQWGLMARLRLGKSYWLDRYTGRVPSFHPMRGARTADVAIVGGGLTGCLAACLLAEAGATVVLLEAQRIGRGSTAASTALLMQEPDVGFRDHADQYGTAQARLIWMRCRESVRGLTRLLRTFRIAAGTHILPSIRLTGDTASARATQRDIARRHRAGLGGRWLTAAAVKRLTGLETAGGVMNAGQAQIDPYGACLGLATHAHRHGVRVCEHSPALRVVGEREGVHIELERGEVRAGWAVIATGYATPDFKPLAGRFQMSSTYVIGTPRIGTRMRREMGLGDVMLWDTSDPYHYARWTPDRRILFGGGDTPTPGSRRGALTRRARQLMQELVERYPALDDMAPAYAWEGVFATTPDGLPYVGPHRRYPRQLFALGYGGNGMTFGYLAAQILVRAVRGHSTDEDRLFGFARFR
jgi:glycine/D-amino acid oxidase-like deaminating enzyme